MTSLGSPLAWNLAAAAALFAMLWLASLPLGDASIVDRFWGAGFVVLALLTAATGDGFFPRSCLVLVLVAVWGLRLSLHITLRNLGRGEDYRYRAMRRHWGPRFALVSLATVFALQAFLMWVVSLPVQIAIASAEPARLGFFDGAGALLWLVGFCFEAVGDEQLRRFKAAPDSSGRILDKGLWRLTRHPNYFGDALQWWGLWLIAVSVPGGFWTIVGPATMTWLLMNLSGVPMLEKKLRRTRPQYEDYCRRTSAFLPWPPRRGPLVGPGPD